MSVLNKTKRFFFSLGAIFLSALLTLNVLSTPVFADPETSQSQATTSEQTQAENQNQTQSQDQSDTTNTCYDESGSLGWLVCPTTGFLARITDGLYDIIEGMLVIKPLTTDSDSSFHQIWSIFRDITNIIFVIFFLIIIFSQVTGIGISNYGIKKLLPKIIVSAILINLSYIICAALVDVSNIVGSSLKGLFSGVEEQITATGIIATSGDAATSIDFNAIVAGLIGGTFLSGLAIGASGGLGALFISLIPVLLGAVVAVGIAYLTIASRQAFVYLLIMVSPLAFVCNLLPNTESWFNKWKKALSQMLFFYPMFAALFGASSLVGWTIIAAAEDAFMLILGIAVKVIPLFASWSLLKMSGTIPGQINSALTKFSAKPLGSLRSYTAEEAALRRAKYLGAKPRTWQYGRQFGQHLQDSKARRLSDTQKYLDIAKLRGAAYASEIHDKAGNISRRGRQLTALSAEASENQRRIMRNANDAEKGIANYAKNEKDKARLSAIDYANMTAADNLFIETGRGEKIRYDNAQSRQDRISAAFDANSNQLFNATKKPTEMARPVNYDALRRYQAIDAALEGDELGAHLVGANATADYDSQVKVLGKKFSSYFSYLPPTQELYDRLFQLTATNHITKDIDPILSGMAALNMRGDTDLVTNVVERMLDTKQIRLGTHASQSLANFCMFTAKDSDVFLRRFGKYINLETARVYNEGQSKGKRRNDVLTMNEYITGRYDEYDDNGNLVEGAGVSKLALPQLAEGTSLDGVERTYFDNMATRIRNAYVKKVGKGQKPDPAEIKAFENRMAEIENAMAPAFISAMLKYPSGSEQMVNGAADLTGYKKKGKEYIPRWNDESDPYYGVDPDFFAKRVKNYLGWQTPQQILSLRTDVFYPIIENLADDYARKIKAHKEDPEHNVDPASEIASELKSIVDVPESELPDWFEAEEIKKDDSPEEKQRKEEKNKEHADERKALRKQFAKISFMDLLFKNNTLDQIMTSRRSGAANAAKRAVRDFLGLDSDDFVEDYRDDSDERKKQHRIERQRRKAERRAQEEEEEEEGRAEPRSETGEFGFSPLYTAEERESMSQRFRTIYNEDPDAEDFYERAESELRTYAGLEHVVDQLRDHRERNTNESNFALLEFILGLLKDDSNFTF